MNVLFREASETESERKREKSRRSHCENWRVMRAPLFLFSWECGLHFSRAFSAGQFRFEEKAITVMWETMELNPDRGTNSGSKETQNIASMAYTAPE